MVRLETRIIGDLTVTVYSVVGRFRIGDAGAEMSEARGRGVRHELWDLRTATFEGWEYRSSAERINQLQPLFVEGFRIAALTSSREQFTTVRMLKAIAETEGIHAEIEVFVGDDENAALRWLALGAPPGVQATLPPGDAD